jgi:hypothetical protein
MRLDVLDDQSQERPVGAAVVRGVRGGVVVVELGPADGPPHVRLTLSREEAARLFSTIQSVAHAGGEEILIVDE